MEKVKTPEPVRLEGFGLLAGDNEAENAGNKRGHSSAGTPGIKRGQSC